MKSSVSRAKYKCPTDLSKIIQEVNTIPGGAVLSDWDEIYYSIKTSGLGKTFFYETNSDLSSARLKFKRYLPKLPLYKQKIQALFELVLVGNGDRFVKDKEHNDSRPHSEFAAIEKDRTILAFMTCAKNSDLPDEDYLVLTYQICTEGFPELAELLERKTARKLALINQITDEGISTCDVIDVLKIEYDRFNKERQILLELIKFSENKNYRQRDFTWTDKIASYAKVSFDPTSKNPFSVTGIAAVINMSNLDRLRTCQICHRIFWLKRKDSKTCSLSCANYLRVKNYRNLTDEQKRERKKQREENTVYNEKKEREKLRRQRNNFS
jgi:hypothetical protein